LVEGDCKIDFFRRLLEFVDAAGFAAKLGVDEGKIYAKQSESRDTIVAAWREAMAVQIQTPAPDLAAVASKRHLAARSHLPITADEIAKAIEADEQWLQAHPTRRSKRVPG
jgi:hypothetical protein